jgi:hypothetical protein
LTESEEDSTDTEQEEDSLSANKTLHQAETSIGESRSIAIRQENMNKNMKQRKPDTLTRLLGRRLDGIIRTKTGQLIYITNPILPIILPINPRTEQRETQNVPEEDKGSPR